MYKNLIFGAFKAKSDKCFNPCFNGTMYKNGIIRFLGSVLRIGFNPCFNGTMYKNAVFPIFGLAAKSFNPCFNGTMYKNDGILITPGNNYCVSILVLMELCIKTAMRTNLRNSEFSFQSLF